MGNERNKKDTNSPSVYGNVRSSRIAW